MADKLVEIPREQWTDLRELYSSEWPRNHLGYYTVNNFIDWIQQDPSIEDVKIFSLNGDYSDGTFLLIDGSILLFNSINESNDRLSTALSLLDWTDGYRVNSFLERHRLIFLKVLRSKNIKLEYESLTLLYYLPAEEALSFNVIPIENIILNPLSEDDVNTVNEIWPHSYNGSIAFLKRLIRWSPNIGAYTKNEGNLIAWCLRLQSGALGVLQVKGDEYKRQGLGTLVAKALSKILADQEHDSFAFVFTENEPSRQLFEKLGFKIIDNVYWAKTLPIPRKSLWNR